MPVTAMSTMSTTAAPATSTYRDDDLDALLRESEDDLERVVRWEETQQQARLTLVHDRIGYLMHWSV